MRETSNAAPPFAPTQAEKQIRALQDASVAQQIVHASRFPVVDRLARGMLDRARQQGVSGGAGESELGFEVRSGSTKQ